MATILYFGNSSPGSTSLHRAKALERSGHTVIHRDPYHSSAGLLTGRFSNILHYRSGYRLIQSRVTRWVARTIREVPAFDLIWVDSGELFGKGPVRVLQGLKKGVLLYNVDDFTGTRDGRRFDSLKKALGYYDLVVVVRKESEEECLAMGVKNVLRVWRSYDEVAHRPFESDNEIPREYRSDVAFIGTWMRHEKRDEFIMTLLNRGIEVRIWGNRWQKSPFWPTLKQHYGGSSLSGRNYVAAMQGAKVCLGLLSRGNRDLHTQRSLEVPFARGLLCAERTTEHSLLFQEGKEAMFWENAETCADACISLLNNTTLRESIKEAGNAKVQTLHVGNEDICRLVIETLQMNLPKK